MNTRRPLIAQIYPPYLALAALAAFALSLYASQEMKAEHLSKIREQLEIHARAFQRVLEESARAGTPDAWETAAAQADVDRLCKGFGETLRSRITVILASGTVIGDSRELPPRMDNHGDRPEIRQALAGQVGVATRHSYTLDAEMMYVAIPVARHGRTLAVIRAATSVSGIQRVLRPMYGRIAAGGVAVALIIGAISFGLAYRISRPLQAMTAGASRFASGALQEPIVVSGSREICTVADALNRMAAQLHDRIEIITQQRNELEAILSSMVEAVIVLDAESRIIRCNQAAGRLFRFALDAAFMRDAHEVIRQIDVQRFVAATLNSATPVEAEIELNSGNEQFLRAHGTLLRVAENQPSGALLVFHNITRLKQLENMRRDFVANVSHELKTPITSITGFVETLRDGAINDPEHASRFLNIIAKNAARLHAIIADLLALSKIEQDEGSGSLPLRPGNLNDVLKTAITLCAPQAEEKRVTLSLDCPERLAVMMDADLIEQAVMNLLDNAIKYSEPGSPVAVRVTLDGDAVTIAVQDVGCGIAPEHLPRVFERFYRVDKARSRDLGGTGLGLAIVKHIVNAHHGSVSAQSALGKGSAFRISLPAPPVAA